MIIQHECEAIVMLTSLIEQDKVKCHEYFPKVSLFFPLNFSLIFFLIIYYLILLLINFHSLMEQLRLKTLKSYVVANKSFPVM